MNIVKMIKVGNQITVEQGLCTIRHNVSSPFDSFAISGITDAELYRVLEQADTVTVVEGKAHDSLRVTVGPLEFMVYQAVL